MRQLHLRLRVQPDTKSRGFLKGINFFSFAGYAMVISYFPLYFKEIGLSVQEIAWVLAIGPLVSTFSQPFWGFMADKTDSVRRTILLVASLTALSCWGVFFKENFYWVFAFMAFFMFFSSPIGPLTELLNLFLVAWGEVAVGLELILGAFTTVALYAGAFMNLNFLLAGTISTNPILLTVAFILLGMGTAAYAWGVDRYMMPWLKGLVVNMNRNDRKVKAN